MATINEEARIPVYINDEEARSALKNLIAEADRLRKAMIEAMSAGDTKGAKKMESELKKVNNQANSLKRSAFDVDKILNNLSSASANDIRKALRSVNKEMDSLNRNTKDYGEAQKKAQLLRAELKSVNTELREQRGLFSKIADTVNRYWSIIGTGIASLISAGKIFPDADKAFTGLEERVSNLSALTKLEGENLQWLSDTAKKTAGATIEGNIRVAQTAAEIADAYTIVGGKRPDLLKSKEALASVTQEAIILSNAAKGPLSESVAGLTMGLNQFGMNADQARRIINVLAAGSQAGAGDIAYLTQAMEKSGTTANLMGVSIEEWAGSIESIAPYYQQASQAGNSFDKVLLKLKANQIGYTNGVFNLSDALNDLEKMYAEGETAAEIFGVEHSKMGELLVQNKNQFLELTKAVTGTDTAIEQAAKNTDNQAAKRAAAMARTNSALIELGETISPLFTKMTEAGAKSVETIAAIAKVLSENGQTIKMLGIAVVSYIAIVNKGILAEKAMKLMQSDNAVARKAGIALIKVQTIVTGKLTIEQKKQIVAAKAAASAQKALSAAMKPSLISLAVTGVSLLISKLIQWNREAIKVKINTAELTKEVMQESREVNTLFEGLKKLTPGSELYNETKEKLRSLYPNLLKYYDLESGSLAEIEAAQRAVNNEILRTVALRTKEKDILDVAEKANKKFSKATENILNLAKNDTDRGALSAMFGNISQEIQNGTKSINEASDEIAEFLNISKETYAYNPYGGSYATQSAGYTKIQSNLKTILSESQKFQSAQQEIDTFYNALLGNTTDYKTILTSINTTESLDKLQQYLNSSDDKIRSSAEKRKKIIQEYNFVNSDINNTESLAELEKYLQSENDLIKKYAEKRKAELNNINKNNDGKGSTSVADISQADRLKKLEEDYKKETALINRARLLKGKTNDEYNDELLKVELNYYNAKLKLLKEGSPEYEETLTQALQKRADVEKTMNNLLLQAEKEFADARINNIRDELEYQQTIETRRWENEKNALRQRLINKKELSEQEQAVNDAIHAQIEEKEHAHKSRMSLINEDAQLRDLNNLVTAAAPVDPDFATLEQQEAFYNARQNLLEAEYERERKMAADNQSALLAAEKNYNAAVYQLDVERIESKFAVVENVHGIMGDYIDSLSAFADEESSLGKALFLFGQANAIGEVWMNVAKANSMALLMPGATAMLQAKNMASGITQTALIMAQTVGKYAGKKSGGYTDKYITDDKVVDFVHSNEFVANADTVRNPTIRPVLDIIDMAQRNNSIASLNLASYMRPRTVGGQDVSASSRPSEPVRSSAASSSGGGDVSELLRETRDVLRDLRDRGVMGVWDWDYDARSRKKMENIRNDVRTS